MRAFLIFLAVLCGLGLVGAGIYFAYEASQQKDAPAKAGGYGSEQSTTGPAVSEDPPIGLNAVGLAKAYAENEVAAEQMYGRHRAMVSGVVKRVWKNSEGHVLLELGGYEFTDVQCVYVGDRQTLIDIKAKQRVRVAGVVAGFHKLLGVLVSQCTVVAE